MSFYSWAFNDLDNPYWACYYGVTTHPLYRQCERCPSRSTCSLPAKKLMFGKHAPPPDCPRDCLKCPKPFFGECKFWNPNAVELKPAEHAPKPTTYEMPRREFVLSKSKFEDKVWEFHLKHGLVYKPEETVYYDRVAGHYAHHKFSLKWWLKRLWQQIKDAF